MLRILRWLNPSNIAHVSTIPYATQFAIELLYSDECLKEAAADMSSEDCFRVQIILNGEVPFEFKGWCKDASLCTFAEFNDYIDEIN